MTQNNYLFNRAWSVAIGIGTPSAPPGVGGGAVLGSQSGIVSATGQQGAAARVYSSFSLDANHLPSPLRLVFDIDKGYSATANKAKIEVYNMSSASRLLYQQADPAMLTTGYQVQLQVGYTSLSGSPPLVRSIYVGDIRRATNKRQGSEIVTSFECGEVEKALLQTFYDNSYPAGTTLLQIVQDLANHLGIPIGSCVGLPVVQYNYGITASGMIRDSLENILDTYGLEFSVQNNALQIKPIGAFNGREIIILSNQEGPGKPGLTGLIGIPSQNQGICQFSSLLNPAIFPGSAVQIFSENIDGQYFQVRRAHFIGDSHGDKWQVDCEGMPLEVPTQTLTGNRGATLRANAELPILT